MNGKSDNRFRAKTKQKKATKPKGKWSDFRWTVGAEGGSWKNPSYNRYLQQIKAATNAQATKWTTHAHTHTYTRTKSNYRYWKNNNNNKKASALNHERWGRDWSTWRSARIGETAGHCQITKKENTKTKKKKHYKCSEKCAEIRGKMKAKHFVEIDKRSPWPVKDNKFRQ